METTVLVEFLLLLLIAASLIWMVARKLRLPYTIALVFGGFVIDLFHLPIIEHLGAGDSSGWLTPEIIFMVFLPGLLFEAGININVRTLLDNIRPILLVAIVGVLVATVVTGYAVSLVTSLPLAIALVYGALISATDPISVLALFKQLGVSKRLAVLVEGESLFNDGAAVVIFQILVAAAVTGELSVGAGVMKFLIVALGGAAIGLGLGYVVSRVSERIDDPQVEITLTTILAYGSFLLAEHFLHVSGVIATVAAGLMIGNFGAKVGMSSRTRVALWTFWEYVGFVINSLIFLLIGIEVHILDLAAYWQPIALAIAAVLVGRAIAVYTVVPVANRMSKPISLAWQHVMTWGGIHGGVSIALALSLPGDFEYRDSIMAMTFGVVAFSIIVQGLTIPPFLRFLGIESGSENEYDQVRVEQAAVARSLEELDVMRNDHAVSPPVYEKLRAELLREQSHVEDRIKGLHQSNAHWAEEEEKLARARLLRAEKTAIQTAVVNGLISHHTAEELIAKADDEIDDLTGVGHA